MKNHLKRIAIPASWTLDRKEKVFVCRPNPGAHGFENGLALGVIIRDILNLASTMDEAKKLLNKNEIIVDGKRRKDHRYILGLFDILKIPLLNKSYRMIFNKKGKLDLIEVKEGKEIKLCKVLGKNILSKGKLQLNLSDGKNILYNKDDVKIGDTIVLELSPSLKVKDILKLSKGVVVYLIRGKYCGDIGVLKEIKGEQAIYVSNDKEIETSKNYLLVVGKDKPLINFV